MTNINKACFFTGHRRIKKELIDTVKGLLKQEIINKYNEGIKTFISGCAKGFDLMASEIVLDLKKKEFPDIELLLYIPCYQYEENYLTYEERCRLLHFKAYCTDILIVDKINNDNDSIKLRNFKMVDDSCVGICYVNHKRSGAYQTIAYAKKQGKDVVNLANLI